MSTGLSLLCLELYLDRFRRNFGYSLFDTSLHVKQVVSRQWHKKGEGRGRLSGQLRRTLAACMPPRQASLTRRQTAEPNRQG